MPSGTGDASGLGRKVLHLAANVWQVLASTPALEATLGVLLLVVVAAAVLPQVGASGRTGEAYEQWRLATQTRWAPALELLESDGARHLLNTPPVRVLLGLAGLLCLVRLVNLWVPAWSLPPRHGVMRYRALLTDDAGLSAVLEAAGCGQNVAERSSARGVRPLLLRERGVAWWLPGTVHVGLLVLLAAALVQWRFGWVGNPRDLSFGQPQALSPSTALAATLQEMMLTESVPGRPEVLRSRVTLEMAGRQARTLTISSAAPVLYHGFTLYQVAFGRALRVQAERLGGEALDVRHVVGDTAPGRVAHVRFDGGQQEQLVLVPSADLLLRLVYYNSLPARGLERPVLHVQVQRASGGFTLAEEFMTEEATVSVGGVRLGLGFEYYLTVRAEREPELPIAAAGGLLLLTGLVAHVFDPPRPAWLVVAECEEGVLVDLVASRRERGATWLRRLIASLDEDA